MRCPARASCSVKDFDSRTALSALSMLRPRLDATERMRAAASFSIFRFISSSGLTWTGPMDDQKRQPHRQDGEEIVVDQGEGELETVEKKGVTHEVPRARPRRGDAR